MRITPESWLYLRIRLLGISKPPLFGESDKNSVYVGSNIQKGEWYVNEKMKPSSDG
jgi:hypothetical protein